MKQKVLFICLPGIGDTLMATPLIELFNKLNPQFEIHCLCMFSGSEYVLNSNPIISNVTSISPKLHKIANSIKKIIKLRHNSFDIAFLTFPSYRREYRIIHWLIGARINIAHQFRSGFFSELSFLTEKSVYVDENIHNVENNLNLLRPLGIDWKDFCTKENIRYILNLQNLKGFSEKDFFVSEKFKNWNLNKTIAIHPGGTNSPAGLMKRWPIERYIELIHRCHKELSLNTIIFLGPEEQECADFFLKSSNDLSTFHIVRDLNHIEALNLLSQLKLLIAGDNGWGHCAAALRVPLISLFAVTNYKWSAPYTSKIRIVKSIPYIPRHRYENKRKKNKIFDGMKFIEVEQVLQEIKTLI
jgi:ADP-heptose:LPS heptosyltransferase